MFQLIVAVISIALVAALAIASLYYGGQAFQKSSLKANVTTLVNAGQQIAGAQALYKTDHSGVGATTVALLQDDNGALAGGEEYLAAAPGVSGAAASAATWSLFDGADTDSTVGDLAGVNVNASASSEVCTEADKQAGNPVVTAWAGTSPVGQFGCYTDTGVVKFGFKL